MRLLIDAGADINACNNDGACALHFAAGDNSVTRMTVLVDAGADVQLMSSGAGNPLHWAAGKGHANAVKYLVGLGEILVIFLH